MKIPALTRAATILFLITHIAETFIAFLLIGGGWNFLTLALNLLTVLVPILFLLKLNSLGEAMKILAIITIVYGFLFIYLNFTEENPFGRFNSWMLIFNLFEILVGAFLYYALFKVNKLYVIEKQ